MENIDYPTEWEQHYRRLIIEAVLPPDAFYYTNSYWFVYQNFLIDIVIAGASDKSLCSIDLGCNKGRFTGLISKFSKKVFAIDPNPLIVNFKNRFNYWWTEPNRSKTIYMCVATSDRAETATYFEFQSPEGDTRDAMNSLVENPYNNPDIVVKDCHRVAVERVDELISQSIGFIKIDVEGLNFKSLKGCEKILKRDNPILIVESTAEANHPTIEYLSSLGYETYPLGWPLKNPTTDSTRCLHNWLAIHKDNNTKLEHIKKILNEFIYFTCDVFERGFDFNRDNPAFEKWVGDYIQSKLN